MGIQSNINSGINTLSYILSLGSKFKKQDNKISENEKGVKENKEGIKKTKKDIKENTKEIIKEIDENRLDIAETKADIHATDEEGNRVITKNITKKPFDPFDKQIEDFKSKLSADEIAVLDLQESRKPGSTRNLVDNYIRSKMKYEKGTEFFRNKAENLMNNATQDDLNDPKFMERIKRYESWGTAPYRTQSDFLANAEQKHYYDTPEERAELYSSGVDKATRINDEQARRDNATNTASDRLKMDVENKMKQETLKEERRNILQNMNTDINNTPRGDM